MSQTNPSNVPAKRLTEADIIPMDMPTLSLGVPEVPGFKLYWALGKNVLRMRRAGYTHVTPEDGIEIENGGLADGKDMSGSTDLGGNVSVLAGSDIDPQTNEPERLYLMKIPVELWEKVEAARENRNESIAAALRSGVAGADNDPDRMKRYMKQGQDLFIPKRRN